MPDLQPIQRGGGRVHVYLLLQPNATVFFWMRPFSDLLLPLLLCVVPTGGGAGVAPTGGGGGMSAAEQKEREAYGADVTGCA
jgi:hypothetical protein